jgi:hypothetical protein
LCDWHGLTCPVERYTQLALNVGVVEVSGCPFWGEGLRIIRAGDVKVCALVRLDFNIIVRNAVGLTLDS